MPHRAVSMKRLPLVPIGLLLIFVSPRVVSQTQPAPAEAGKPKTGPRHAAAAAPCSEGVFRLHPCAHGVSSVGRREPASHGRGYAHDGAAPLPPESAAAGTSSPARVRRAICLPGPHAPQ